MHEVPSDSHKRVVLSEAPGPDPSQATNRLASGEVGGSNAGTDRNCARCPADDQREVAGMIAEVGVRCLR